MNTVLINFLIEINNRNGRAVETIDEIRAYNRSLSGYNHYKNGFAEVFINLIKKIDLKFQQIILSSEVVDDRLPGTAKLLFRRAYKTVQDLQDKLNKAAEADFPSLWSIWRKNLSREFHLKI